jgi:hypothetical protein
MIALIKINSLSILLLLLAVLCRKPGGALEFKRLGLRH